MRNIEQKAPRLFKAKYNGNCAVCHLEILKGDFIGFNSNSKVVCVSCIGDSDREPELIAEETFVPISSVMPPGRSAGDRCNSCFLIHSTAQKDCE